MAATRTGDDLVPVAVDVHSAVVVRSERESEPRRTLPGVLGAIGHRRQDPLHMHHGDGGVVSGQSLGQRAQAQRVVSMGVRVGFLFAQQREDLHLHRSRTLATSAGRFDDAVPQEGRHEDARRQQAGLLHVDEDAQDRTTGCGGVLGTDDPEDLRQAEEVVRTETFVRAGVHQAREDR